MLVCHCQAVSDRAIRRAVREGASSREAVARACAAGSHCGGCHALIDEIVESECSAGHERGAFPTLRAVAAAR